MSEQCDCPIRDGDRFIFCPRHNVKKYRRTVELCRERGKYWEAMEAGWIPNSGDQEQTVVKAPREPAMPGPGSHLRAIIASWQERFPWFNLSEYPGCKCGETARLMDRWGVNGCLERVDDIVNKLEDEAKKRNLSVPFRRTIAKILVLQAIKRSADQLPISTPSQMS